MSNCISTLCADGPTDIFDSFSCEPRVDRSMAANRTDRGIARSLVGMVDASAIGMPEKRCPPHTPRSPFRRLAGV